MENILEKLKENWKIISLVSLEVVIGGIFYVFTQGHHPDQMISTTALPTSSSTHHFTSKSSTSSTIMVDLKGAVVKPDVYKISADDRVDDLIKMAGGFTSDADQKTVNLAAKLKDEEVIDVGKVGESAPISNSQENSTAINSGSVSNSQEQTTEVKKVNINSADVTELESLSGIGEKKAQDIIDYREKNGPFKNLDDLGNVGGFGDKTLAKLKGTICFD